MEFYGTTFQERQAARNRAENIKMVADIIKGIGYVLAFLAACAAIYGVMVVALLCSAH